MPWHAERLAPVSGYPSASCLGQPRICPLSCGFSVPKLPKTPRRFLGAQVDVNPEFARVVNSGRSASCMAFRGLI